jgi:hypothetical protein
MSKGGYNSVYLTPVQRISPLSGSAFCVADQSQLGLSLFDGSESASTGAGAFDQLRAVIDSSSAKLNLTFVTDIVLNHIALDSPFLLDHPECAYNLSNSPHLRAPALLDAALHSFSRRVLDAEFVSSGLVPVVLGTSVVFNLDNDAEISKFVNVFFTQVLPSAANIRASARAVSSSPSILVVSQVIPGVPLIQHYTFDTNLFLARANKLWVSAASAEALPPPRDVHGLFKKLRGRQIDVATDAQLQLLVEAIFCRSGAATDPTGAAVSPDDRLRQAAAQYNADAALDLSDDLNAAADSIRSTMCARHLAASPLPPWKVVH